MDEHRDEERVCAGRPQDDPDDEPGDEREQQTHWTIRYAMAQIDVYGWRSVPEWLAMSVQMIRYGYGCASCGR